MPARLVRGEILTSHSLSLVSMEAELAFDRAVIAADDFGRLDARPAALKAALFPIRESVTGTMVRKWIEELAAAPEPNPPAFIYAVDGREYVQLTGFERHRGKTTHRSRKFPEPPEDCERLRPVVAVAVAVGVAEAVVEAEGGSGGKQPIPRAAPSPPSALGYQVADALRDMTLRHCPEEPRFKQAKTRDADARESDAWAATVPHATQLKALKWAEAQPPRGTFRWAANLRSVAKLRKKYPDIAAQARTEKASQAPANPATVPDRKTRENIEAERQAIEESRRLRESPQLERMIGGLLK